MPTTIYHNPNCTTSRNTLALMCHAGLEVEVIEYLKTPPGKAKLKQLLADMNMTVRALLRKNGTPYAELNLDDPNWSDDQLLDFTVEHPILMERPIVATSLGTKVCRPVEEVLELLPLPQIAPFTKENGEQVVDHGTRRS
jgi:arsenate reductase